MTDYSIVFMENVVFDLYQILQFPILPGVTLWTVFFYCLLASCFFTVFSRR